MKCQNIIYSINEEIKQEFKDYKGLYFYGSRIKNSARSGIDLIKYRLDGALALRED